MKQGIRKYLNEQIKFLEGKTPVPIPNDSDKEALNWIKNNTVDSVWYLAGHYWFESDTDASSFILHWK